MNTENRKSNEPHKFVLILPRRSDSKSSANMLLFTICLLFARNLSGKYGKKIN